MRWLDSTTDPTDMNLSKLQEIVEGRGAWHATVCGVTKDSDMTKQQQSASIGGVVCPRWTAGPYAGPAAKHHTHYFITAATATVMPILHISNGGSGW